MFGALMEVGRLERAARANRRCELIEQDGIVLAVGDILGEVLNPVTIVSKSCCRMVEGQCILPVPFGVLEMIVEPSE